jgi:hypothetical protein
VSLLVVPQPLTETFVRLLSGIFGGWAHDQDSMDHFVPITGLPIFNRVELFDRNQNAIESRMETIQRRSAVTMR